MESPRFENLLLGSRNRTSTCRIAQRHVYSIRRQVQGRRMEADDTNQPEEAR
jgi:hypothetical protein